MSRLPLENPTFGALVAPFIEAGLVDLGAAHVVDLLAGALPARSEADVLLGLALAASAPARGHVGVDLLNLPGLEAEHADLPLPEDRDAWRDRVAASPLVGLAGGSAPFSFEHGLLLPRRYASYQGRLAARLLALAAPPEVPPPRDEGRLRADLDALFPAAHTAPDDLQRIGALAAVLGRLTVISGGPGTGKTYTVRTVLALLFSQWMALHGRPPRVALAAPTGKAAARMREAIRTDLERLQLHDTALTADVRAWLVSLGAETLHRLLGFQPANPTRFRHGPEHPLPFEVIVVDEASMVDLAMMCKLVEAVGPGARLVLLGDRNQLASVEAGSVLADLTRDPRATGVSASRAEALAAILPAARAGLRVLPDAPPLADAIAHFTRPRRVVEGSGLQALAWTIVDDTAPLDGRVAAARAWLSGEAALSRGPFDDLALLPHGPGATLPEPLLAALREAWRGGRGDDAGYLALLDAASRATGEARMALLTEALRRFDRARVLAVHREGPVGVRGLNAALEAEVLGRGAPHGRWGGPRHGRPLMVTENSYELGVMNGDIGLTVRLDDRLVVAFPGREAGRVILLSPAQLPAHEPAFAMTVHKSQGSEFQHAVLVLPDRESPLLTRELVYTGLTRARRRVTVCGDLAILEAALRREVRRASALDRYLW